MGCLNASRNQQQRTAQAGKMSQNQSQAQKHGAQKIQTEVSAE